MYQEVIIALDKIVTYYLKFSFAKTLNSSFEIWLYDQRINFVFHILKYSSFDSNKSN